jgi:hypothetical protein
VEGRSRERVRGRVSGLRQRGRRAKCGRVALSELHCAAASHCDRALTETPE